MPNLRGRMGPGGPRRLQIWLSGASSVRGGFDSHAFPPLTVLLLAALACATGPTSAIAAPAAPPAGEVPRVAAPSSRSPGDSLEIGRADSSAGFAGDSVRVALSDTTASAVAGHQKRRARAAEDLSRWEQPHWVMLRSLVIPGWGQVHNGSWIKAVGVAAGEAGLTWKIFDDRRKLDQLSAEAQDARAAGDDIREIDLVDQYNTLLNGAVARQWLLGAVVAFAMLDAYIDAHFHAFRLEFETDPALPGGNPPKSNARFSLRWSF